MKEESKEKGIALVEKILAGVLSPGLKVAEKIFGLGRGTKKMLYGKRKSPYGSALISYARGLRDREKEEKEEDFPG